MTVTIPRAKIELDMLIQRAAKGEEVVITCDDAPVAKLVAVDGPMCEFKATGTSILPFGFAKDKLKYIAEDFDAPLDDLMEYMVWRSSSILRPCLALWAQSSE